MAPKGKCLQIQQFILLYALASTWINCVQVLDSYQGMIKASKNNTPGPLVRASFFFLNIDESAFIEIKLRRKLENVWKPSPFYQSYEQEALLFFCLKLSIYFNTKILISWGYAITDEQCPVVRYWTSFSKLKFLTPRGGFRLFSSLLKPLHSVLYKMPRIWGNPVIQSEKRRSARQCPHLWNGTGSDSE